MSQLLHHTEATAAQHTAASRTMQSVVYLFELQTTVNRVEEIIVERGGGEAGLMCRYSQGDREYYKSNCNP
jgi:hypothetical protein